MGLSSSSTKQTSNQTENSSQTQNATTTPVTPDWLTQAAQDYVGRIGSFGDMDPNSFVAPAAPLQQMAWQNASSLGDWRQQTATASQMAQQAGSLGANYAGAGGAMGRWAGTDGLSPSLQPGGGPAQVSSKFSGQPQPTSELARPAQNAFSGASSQPGPAYTYQAPNVGNVAGPTAYQAAQTSLGNAPQASASGYTAAQLGNAPQASASGYGAPRLGNAPQASASGYNAPTLNMPGLVSGAGYAAPQLGSASGYAAARVGAPIGATAATYQAPIVGSAPSVSGTSYDASQVTAPTIGNVAGATATDANAGNISGNLSRFQNPYQQQVIDTSLADFDHNAQMQQAQLEAQGAASGAFGGSRFGIAQSNLLADQGRSRATLDAGIRAQGFDTAAGLAGQQAGLDQNTNLFNAQNQTGISQFNSGQNASLAQAQAGLNLQGGIANQQALDQAGQFGAQSKYDAGLATAQLGASRDQLQAQLQAQAAGQNASAITQNSQFNAGQGLQASLAQAGLDTDASKYAADMGNQYGLQQAMLNANAGQYNATNAQSAALANQNIQGQFGLAQGQLAANAGQFDAANAQQTALANQTLAGQFGLAQGQLDANAGQYNAGNAQQASLANQALAAQYALANQAALGQAGQFNAAAANQAALANQNLAGQYGLAQFGADTQAAQNYAAALNAAGLAGYQGNLGQAQLQAQLAAAAGQYNAGANNQMSQFNATQADNAANRQLQAAGMLGSLANDYGSGTRADLTTMGQLGDQQRSIEQAYAMAGPAQLQLMGQLSGMTPYQILVGQNVNGTTTGTGTSSGTTTTVQNPSLFSQLLAGASLIPQSALKF